MSGGVARDHAVGQPAGQDQARRHAITDIVADLLPARRDR
jgi:hypothetical protein